MDEDIPLWLIIMGSMGQVIFTLRFVYQWYYSKKFGASVLPVNFLDYKSGGFVDDRLIWNYPFRSYFDSGAVNRIYRLYP